MAKTTDQDRAVYREKVKNLCGDDQGVIGHGEKTSCRGKKKYAAVSASEIGFSRRNA